MKVSVSALSYCYNDGTPVLEDIDFCADKHQITAILGSSGSGKSTLLRIISGLLSPLKGAVCIDDLPVLGCGKDRSVLSVNTPLLPWMSVRANIVFALRQYGLPHIASKADKIIRRLDIEDFGDRYPLTLSSGMTKQAMLARAIAVPSELLLLDEPLAEVDPNKRSFYHAQLRQIAEDRTIILVTHDLDEALQLAHKIYLLDKDERRMTHCWHPADHLQVSVYGELKREILTYYRQEEERTL